MRVAIVNLTGGGLSGGYLKYLKRLVPHLLRDPDVEQLDVFVPEAARDRLRDEPWPIRTWPAGDARRGFAHLKGTVRDQRPDVVFVPTAGWLRFGDTKVVVMVRNMEPLEVPFAGNPPREMARNLVRRVMARRACRRAARIIAVSQHVREYLMRQWNIDSDRIGVIYHGADPPDMETAPMIPHSFAGGPDCEFVFTAGSIRPARGLTDLVEALPHLRSAQGPLAAVVAGHTDASTDAHRQRLIGRARQLGVAQRIHWIGPLSEAEMRWCYESCKVFVMTSRAEACPNIALEAMSHGCACVSVDHAPMPEFFGPAALYYRAGNATALAQAVSSVASGAIDVAGLRSAAFARARAFDWRATARHTIAELRAAVRS